MSNDQFIAILALINKEVRKVKPESPPIKANTGLTSDLGLDSVQILEMLMNLEDDLDMSIPINRLGDVHTAGQLADHLVKMQADA